MRAIKYILDKAEALGFPVAVNISFGTNNGSHDGSSLFETYVNAAAQRWKTVIVVATGNEASAGHHYSSTVQTGQTIEASFTVAQNLNSLYITLWKDFVDEMVFELISPGGQSTGELNSSAQYTRSNLEETTVQIYFGQPTHYNEDQEIFIQMQNNGSAISQGLWRLKITGTDIVEGRVDIWLPTVEEVGIMTAFASPAVETTLTLPSTALNVISVGGYNSMIQSFAQFSGRGYTRNHVYVKPDLVAPAVGILSPRAGGGYDTFSGTSMAAPFVTGASALLMQWGITLGNDPFLYGQRVKALLKRGAGRDASRLYPNPMWGYGTLCLKNTLDYLRRQT